MLSLIKHHSVLLVAIVTLTGCTVAPLQPNKNNPIESLAILPPVNASNNVSEPLAFQRAVGKALANRHYRLLSVEESNRVLRDEFSLTLGKQLADFTPEELVKNLDVSGLLYLYVLKADTLGSKSNYQVGMKLIDASGKQHYGKGVFVTKESSGDALAFVINTASDLKHFADDKPLSLPTSKQPEKEMPGLNRLIYMPKPAHHNELGFLQGLALTAIKAGIGITFDEERHFALGHLIPFFPIGPGIIEPVGSSGAVQVDASSTTTTIDDARKAEKKTVETVQ